MRITVMVLRKHQFRYVFGVIGSLMALLTVGGTLWFLHTHSSQIALAAAKLPAAADMSAGNQVYAEVARSGNGNSLDAVDGYYAVYFTQPTGKIFIDDFDYCVGEPDANGTSYPTTNFDVFRTKMGTVN